jgi:hypothetical protein
MLPILIVLASASCGEDQNTENKGQSGGITGGFNNGGSLPGGSNNGGSLPGGSNNGGSLPGGSNNGGSLPGGSNNGGSLPGGSNNGGSLPGGSNNGGSNGGSSNIAPITLDDVQIEFLSLVALNINDKIYFPSLIAHLLGSSIYGQQFDFACFKMTNTSSEGIDFRIGVEVVGYSSEAVDYSYLLPGEEKSICLNPIFDSQQIQSLRQSVRSSLKINYAINGSTDLKEESIDLEMMPFNMMPHGYIDAMYQSVFVTPNSQWIQDIQDDVNRNSIYGGFGVGGFGEYLEINKDYDTLDIPDGYQQQLESIILKQDEFLTINFQSIYSNSAFLSGEIEQAFLHIVDNSGNIVYQQDVDANLNSIVVFQANNFESYGIVVGLYSSAVANINQIKYNRNVSKSEKALDYLQAIFYTLRALNISYANINSFEDAQIIRSPNDVVRSGAANCLEGTLTFASIAELFEINSQVITSFVNGHAFYGLIDEDGTVWPIETTVVGDFTFTFEDALILGINQQSCWFQGVNCSGSSYDENASAIDIFSARQNGIESIPYDF